MANIQKETLQNQNFRSALWTGNHLQVTLMCIPAGEDIGLELHSCTDQFLCIEQGQGVVMMGNNKNQMDFQQKICKGDAIIVPACTCHNIVNTGGIPLKLYSIYAPPHHPRGTVHQTKQDAKELRCN